MTKGADDETEMEDGMTTSERRRRRRRGAGLRIPSDNVPRRASGPVVAPVPEDPAVAMSIAYAFADEPSGSARIPTGDLDPDVSDLGELDDATSIATTPLPAVPDGSVPGIPGHVVDDVVPDGRTRQMAAVSLEALGLGAIEEELSGGQGGGTVTAPAEPHNETVDIDVDGIEDAPDEDSDDISDFEEREEVPITTRPATIPPPFPTRAHDPSGHSGHGTIPPPMPHGPSELAARGVLEAKDRANTDVDEADAAPESAAPHATRDEAIVAMRLPRAHTVALSEDDLEELLENTPPPRGAPQPPPALAGVAAPAPVATVPSLPSLTPLWAVVASPSVSAAPVPSAAPDAPAMGNITGESVALAEEDLQEVATPSDASDSGEILADEIVEVEQESRAPVAIPQQPSGPVHMAPPPPPAQPATAPKPPTPPAAPAPKKSVATRAAAAAAAAQPGDPEAKKKRRGKPWFEEVFDEDYLRTLPFLTPQATQSEAMMVIESLGVQAGAAVLDVGCGYGRHAMELAARGFHVVGVDLSLPLLLRGADEAQRRGLDINFVHADMREMDFDAQFDGAYCLFSTFGFFDDETNKKAATLIAKALKPGAKFMLEILNRDYVIGDLPARVWWEGDGCVVLEEVEFNYFSSRVQSKRSVVFDDGRQVEQEISVRVYSLHEVGKLLHAAGLRVLEVSGSMASRGRFLGNRSREIIVVAERRPPDGKS